MRERKGIRPFRQTRLSPRAIETFHKAMLDGDKARLENLLAEQMSYGDLSDGKLETRAQFVDRIVRR